MFGVDSGELFIIVLIAVVVIGPKELPRALRTVGQWVGRARGMANQFRAGVDQMVRESEIADLEKKWREQNEAIMRAHPADSPGSPGSAAEPVSDWGLPAPPATSALPAPAAAAPAPLPPAYAHKPAIPAPLAPAYPAPRAMPAAPPAAPSTAGEGDA